MNEETRLRLGAKQTAKGGVQLDITAEAPTVGMAEELLKQGFEALKRQIEQAGLKTVDQQ